MYTYVINRRKYRSRQGVPDFTSKGDEKCKILVTYFDYIRVHDNPIINHREP